MHRHEVQSPHEALMVLTTMCRIRFSTIASLLAQQPDVYFIVLRS